MTCHEQHLLDDHEDDTDAQPPPTYESTTSDPKEKSDTAPVPQPVPQPVPSSDVVDPPGLPSGLPASSAFNRYILAKREHGIVSLNYVINPRAPRTWKAAQWEATLTVLCHDVPRLMREGLFWSVDNIVPEEGFIQAARPESKAIGYSHVRTWILTDKPESRGGHRTPDWVACLEVSTTTIEGLAGFRPKTLTRAHIWKANAWDVHRRPIYNYDSYAPAQNFNCVYDDMPLRGWWPWPRGEDRE
ncbi:hypothetical protein NEMBOFW57_010884 [Staphylotrichum longicolle]|uniref:Uncharacterized protein n=1 Tax=Staphylotrichum longicolle TaxID=669026 RepID=A0AAD4HT84_9PEZI|nr:hypothetical protein NEMBOFW57_010884 [Staphylotrichum longicolle]